ncbi:MAG: hypothetical protein ABJB66_10580 [Gemmatimonadaceae bacterium]
MRRLRAALVMAGLFSSGFVGLWVYVSFVMSLGHHQSVGLMFWRLQLIGAIFPALIGAISGLVFSAMITVLRRTHRKVGIGSLIGFGAMSGIATAVGIGALLSFNQHVYSLRSFAKGTFTIAFLVTAMTAIIAVVATYVPKGSLELRETPVLASLKIETRALGDFEIVRKTKHGVLASIRSAFRRR